MHHRARGFSFQERSPPVIRLICSPTALRCCPGQPRRGVFLSRPAGALHATRSIVTDARPSTRIVYWFDRNDYDAIRQLFADDLQLPSRSTNGLRPSRSKPARWRRAASSREKQSSTLRSSPRTVRRAGSIKMLKRLERSLSSLIGRIMSVAYRPRRASLQRKLMPDGMVAHMGASDVRAHRNHAGRFDRAPPRSLRLHPTVALQDGYTARPTSLLVLDKRCGAPRRAAAQSNALGAVAQTKRR